MNKFHIKLYTWIWWLFDLPTSYWMDWKIGICLRTLWDKEDWTSSSFATDQQNIYFLSAAQYKVKIWCWVGQMSSTYCFCERLFLSPQEICEVPNVPEREHQCLFSRFEEALTTIHLFEHMSRLSFDLLLGFNTIINLSGLQIRVWQFTFSQAWNVSLHSH